MYDDVQYTKNDWRNRNRIKTPQGTMWLTIPVDQDDRMTKNRLIMDISIRNELPWKKQHLKSVAMNYKKAPYFDDIYQIYEVIMNRDYDRLCAMNVEMTRMICNYLGIRTKIVRASEIGFSAAGQSLRLKQICDHFKATHYLSGPAARTYLKTDIFEEMKVVWQHYIPCIYKQQWGKFVPRLSILDLLFNEGPGSLKIIRNGELSVF
jgi:hypothetical protein